jgi:hypothetical protein
MYVPVLSSTGNPLMPAHPGKARMLVKSGLAVKRWLKGIFYIQLTIQVKRYKQEVVCGVDPGSKWEGFSVVGRNKDFINVMSNAVDWVKDKVESRRTLRRARRFRKTPCRSPRFNNKSKEGISPSTKARWNTKLRIINILRRLFPITGYAVEDIVATTREGQKKFNVSFSPLEVGKKYFYEILRRLGQLTLFKGYETKELRDLFGVKKTRVKNSETFSSHCVDSWVMAKSTSGGSNSPTDMKILRLIPLNLKRRSLHKQVPHKGGIRTKAGGSTPVKGIKNGTTVLHNRTLKYISGGMDGKYLSLNSMTTGKRLNKGVSPKKLQILSYSSFRYYWV